MIWSFFTLSLKSAYSFTTRPETCAPTCTVVRADNVPAAVTCAEIEPFVTLTVVNVISGALGSHGFLIHNTAVAAAISAITITRGIQRASFGFMVHLVRRTESPAGRSCPGRASKRGSRRHRELVQSDARVRAPTRRRRSCACG